MAGNLRAILAELIGTFALVFVGAGAVCMDVVTGGRLGPVGIAFAHGLILTGMIYTYGPISGGYFNPAVTAAMFLLKRLDLIKGVFYVFGQLLGAVLAAVCLKAVLHNWPQLINAAPFLGGCDLCGGIGYKAGSLLEAIATFFLVSVYATASPQRSSGLIGPTVIGMVWSGSLLTVSPLTGAALNPARTFGPAVVTGHWANGFVYWIGPTAGAVAAYWIYELLNLSKKR